MKTYWSILQDSSGSESSKKQPITSKENNSPRDSDDDFHSTREASIVIPYNSPFQDFLSRIIRLHNLAFYRVLYGALSIESWV